jgi:hypothetical protein
LPPSANASIIPNMITAARMGRMFLLVKPTLLYRGRPIAPEPTQRGDAVSAPDAAVR